MNIIGKSECTAAQMAQYLISRNPNAKSWALEYAKLYLEEGDAEGVRGDGAWIQSCKETGNFKFSGGTAVTFDQNNFCGLGVTRKGLKGHSFDTPRLGIRAQIQHLKAYATAAPLVNPRIDPRYTYVAKGCAPRFEDLAGKWAMPGYDTTKASSLEDAMNKKIGYGFDIISGIETMKKIVVSTTPTKDNNTNANKEENSMITVNNNLTIHQCFLTNNNCYKQGRKIVPTGIVVHSTGANNPSLKRYVQPDDGILGTNTYNNDWNRSGISKCVHAFIGKDKNGKVRVYQTLPWDYRCWGCGSGSKGSYNNNFIQFEVCEDSLSDVSYFNECFRLAAELCAYLAKKYNIPTANIVSHNEAYSLGYASNHADCDHWLRRFSKNMDWFRQEVASRKGETISTPSSVRSYLMKGDNGTEVKTLQENLNYIGYSCGIADGIFGAKTDTALRKFQKAYKLTVDGKYGTSSKKALENAVAKKKATPTSSAVKGNYNLVFNATYYSNKYPDLKAAFGTNTNNLLNHFKTYGISEGRQAISTFDVKVYKEKNADLQKAFGNDYKKYVEHYLTYGYKENRVVV